MGKAKIAVLAQGDLLFGLNRMWGVLVEGQWEASVLGLSITLRSGRMAVCLARPACAELALFDDECRSPSPNCSSQNHVKR